MLQCAATSSIIVVAVHRKACKHADGRLWGCHRGVVVCVVLHGICWQHELLLGKDTGLINCRL
jgi:hypothetical protein